MAGGCGRGDGRRRGGSGCRRAGRLLPVGVGLARHGRVLGGDVGACPAPRAGRLPSRAGGAGRRRWADVVDGCKSPVDIEHDALDAGGRAHAGVPGRARRRPARLPATLGARTARGCVGGRHPGSALLARHAPPAREVRGVRRPDPVRPPLPAARVLERARRVQRDGHRVGARARRSSRAPPAPGSRRRKHPRPRGDDVLHVQPRGVACGRVGVRVRRGTRPRSLALHHHRARHRADPSARGRIRGESWATRLFAGDSGPDRRPRRQGGTGDRRRHCAAGRACRRVRARPGTRSAFPNRAPGVCRRTRPHALSSHSP